MPRPTARAERLAAEARRPMAAQQHGRVAALRLDQGGLGDAAAAAEAALAAAPTRARRAEARARRRTFGGTSRRASPGWPICGRGWASWAHVEDRAASWTPRPR
jgi:hypothetical protein